MSLQSKTHFRSQLSNAPLPPKKGVFIKSFFLKKRGKSIQRNVTSVFGGGDFLCFLIRILTLFLYNIEDTGHYICIYYTEMELQSKNSSIKKDRENFKEKIKRKLQRKAVTFFNVVHSYTTILHLFLNFKTNSLQTFTFFFFVTITAINKHG